MKVATRSYRFPAFFRPYTCRARAMASAKRGAWASSAGAGAASAKVARALQAACCTWRLGSSRASSRPRTAPAIRPASSGPAPGPLSAAAISPLYRPSVQHETDRTRGRGSCTGVARRRRPASVIQTVRESAAPVRARPRTHLEGAGDGGQHLGEVGPEPGLAALADGPEGQDG